MDILWILLPILFFAAFFAWWLLVHKPNKAKKLEKRILDNIGIPGLSNRWENSELTPYGARIIWNGSVFNSDAEKRFVFECLDVGFQNCFNASKEVFPTWDYNPAYITLAIVEPSATNLDGSKAIRMTNGLQIAGAVIGKDDNYGMLTIVIPSQKENGWRYSDYVMRTAWHEREHFDEARSDDAEYYSWGRTPERPADVHPHRPLPAHIAEIPAPPPLNAVRSLAKIPVDFVCGTMHGVLMIGASVVLGAIAIAILLYG